MQTKPVPSVEKLVTNMRFRRTKNTLVETITARSCYMLRNDGELFECQFHPYIVRGTKDTDDMVFADNAFNTTALEWFLEHSNNSTVVDYIKKYLYEDTENISLLRKIDKLCNEEFCRVRTSNIKAPYGYNGDTYFRIYPSGFNWFDLIWDIVNRNKNFITTVTICTDEQSTGETIYYNHHGRSFNKMPVEEFITISGNPVIEKLNESLDGEELLEDVTDKRNEQLQELDEVRELLTSQGFKEERKLNGVAFVNDTQDYIKAQMYVDTTNFNYSCYVNYDNEETESTSDFSLGGTIDSMLTAARRLLREFNGI